MPNVSSSSPADGEGLSGSVLGKLSGKASETSMACSFCQRMTPLRCKANLDSSCSFMRVAICQSCSDAGRVCLFCVDAKPKRGLAVAPGLEMDKFPAEHGAPNGNAVTNGSKAADSEATDSENEALIAPSSGDSKGGGKKRKQPKRGGGGDGDDVDGGSLLNKLMQLVGQKDFEQATATARELLGKARQAAVDLTQGPWDKERLQQEWAEKKVYILTACLILVLLWHFMEPLLAAGSPPEAPLPVAPVGGGRSGGARSGGSSLRPPWPKPKVKPRARTPVLDEDDQTDP
mmetsp:Transcript_82276/g.177662  ORF Transcript_82276/g.177662 Transcript_82276/m.177662 type:complete len:289 (+) Transcript_82276:70-936(+)